MKKIDKKLLIECVEQVISWEENMDRAYKLKKVKSLFNEEIYQKIPTTYYIKLNQLLFNLEKQKERTKQ
jgi:hypothetical protein